MRLFSMEIVNNKENQEKFFSHLDDIDFDVKGSVS